jgi:ATP-binding cassette, subfamily C, bacterial PrsD
MTKPPDPVTEGLAECRARLVKIAAFSGVINVLTLSGSLYMMQVYDRVIPGRSIPTLVSLSIMVLLAYLFQGYLDAVRSRMLARTGAMFELKLQPWLFRVLTILPLQGASAAFVHQPLRDLEQIRAFLSGMGPVAFLDMPWMPLFLIVLFLFHPVIGLIALFGAMAIIFFTLWGERRSTVSARQASGWITQRQVLAEATRRNADVIRAMGMTHRLQARWARLNEGAILDNLRAMDVHANLGAIAKVTRYTLQSAILGAGALLVINDQASGGIMIASSIIMGRALAPIEVALGTWRQLEASRQGIQRLRSVLLMTGPPDPEPVALTRPSRGISVTNLAVAAPGSESMIVSKVGFNLAAGTGLALIGPSGSGKTSLAKTLIGLWPPAAGTVHIDGTPLPEWLARDPGQHLGYLPQDVALFEGTIAANISRFDAHATPATIIDAAMIAGAHDMIAGLPHQYHTAIGEGGVMLSAGQRQRIGLARAVFGNPFLIVLDEPNANLDTEGEQALNGCLQILKSRGAIIIVISHRPMVLEALDSLMVLAGGTMIAAGPRQAVAAALVKMAGANVTPMPQRTQRATH